METEALQLLNLSPIPEISEIELSTMLEQLSGLSEPNSNMTDVNIEDIIKEAEKLIDKSALPSVSSLECDKKIVSSDEAVACTLNSEAESNILNNDNSAVLCENITPIEQKFQYSSNPCSLSEINLNKSNDSLERQDPEIKLSPNGTSNHIKSTIDSLREFSHLIERKMANKKAVCPKGETNITTSDTENFKVLDVDVSKSSKTGTQCALNLLKDVKCNNMFNMESSLETITKDQNIKKKVSCFERLYKSKPVRLANNHNVKSSDKMNKVSVKKKNSLNLKGSGTQSKLNEKTSSKHFENKRITSTKKKEKFQFCGEQFKKTAQNKTPELVIESNSEKSEFFKRHDNSNDNEGCPNQGPFTSLKVDQISNEDEDLNFESRKPEPVLTPCFLKDDIRTPLTYTFCPAKGEDQIMLRLLQELKDIKDKIQLSGTLKDEKKISESEAIVLKEEIHQKSSSSELPVETVESEDIVNINQLQKQFYTLKGKYEQQIARLESENTKLKKVLNFRSEKSVFAHPDVEENKMVGLDDETVKKSTESKNVEISKPNQWPLRNEEVKMRKSVSLENFKIPENASSCNFCIKRISASSQTEKELKNISVQCVDEERIESNIHGSNRLRDAKVNINEKYVEEFENLASISDETKKIEIKENDPYKRKVSRPKPFSDVNVYQSAKPKKMPTEHETQLMVALRGVRAEVLDKDKENKKLRAEIDFLKTHIRRLGLKKNEGIKRCHVGVQTIGLGPPNQQFYDPRQFEEGEDLEKENKELKERIEALEESFALLKEKRISDLQTLHQVHEKEMAKLVSKLQSQSALTKHLHSLLIKR